MEATWKCKGLSWLVKGAYTLELHEKDRSRSAGGRSMNKDKYRGQNNPDLRRAGGR